MDNVPKQLKAFADEVNSIKDIAEIAELEQWIRKGHFDSMKPLLLLYLDKQRVAFEKKMPSSITVSVISYVAQVFKDEKYEVTITPDTQLGELKRQLESIVKLGVEHQYLAVKHGIHFSDDDTVKVYPKLLDHGAIRPIVVSVKCQFIPVKFRDEAYEEEIPLEYNTVVAQFKGQVFKHFDSSHKILASDQHLFILNPTTQKEEELTDDQILYTVWANYGKPKLTLR